LHFVWILEVLHDALLLILARAMTECFRMLRHVARLRRMMTPQLRDACHGPVLVPSHTNPELTAVELRPLATAEEVAVDGVELSCCAPQTCHVRPRDQEYVLCTIAGKLCLPRRADFSTAQQDTHNM
jgi:hypothetical protein